MRRAVGLSLGMVLVVAACSGSTGPTGATGAMGEPGKAGAPGTSGAASVSAISPPYAFQSRTVNLSIIGNGTTWDAKTTVAFANAGVKVNSVTVASATGLVANVTVAADAALGTTDVTVTSGTSSAVYAGVFAIQAALTVTATPTAGIQQGGLANLHVAMNDLTTPFDPDTTNVTLSSPSLAMSQPTPSDYAFDMTIQADVLATPGTSDLTVTSGETTVITSVAPKSVTIVARAPTKLTAGTPATGNLETELDTLLYEFTPASASQEFIQFSTTSMAGVLQGTVIPKSGAYADALDTYAVRYAQGITLTDPFYIVVGDSNGLFGPGPTPADSTTVAFESPCTAVNEITETAAANDDTYETAQPVTALPALVNGTLGYGSVAPAMDVDVYAITVLASAKNIHVATGGDPADDAVVSILSSTGTVLATSADDDFQQDLVFPSPGAGTYYISITASTGGNFSPTDNTYQLFIAAE